MAMDAAWKVYVGDRRFDDNQISNIFLKLKYETVGRFTFDFRPIDGDEVYMVPNNTLRIFWGDLHKLDGVIQRVDWDSTQFCYHVYGADIRGFLLDQVNMEPATVSSYTSDVQTQVMYNGCDFPSNIWTGAGDQIGKYTFHYKLGIQNTIRITGATQNVWTNIIERGTVYAHVGGCLYDATKNWATNQYAGATLRFVSGACKNNVYNVNGNTTNRVCIRLPGEPASLYQNATQVGTYWVRNSMPNPGFEDGTAGWTFYPFTGFGGVVEIVSPGFESGNCLHILSGDAYAKASQSRATATADLGSSTYSVSLRYKIQRDQYYVNSFTNVAIYPASGVVFSTRLAFGTGATLNTNPSWPSWDYLVCASTVTGQSTANVTIQCAGYSNNYRTNVWIDDVVIGPALGTSVWGTVPGCSRIGDIYEIVTASMSQTSPASTAPATLQKDSHIINYNQTDTTSDHTTTQTVTGNGDNGPIYPSGWHWPWDS